MYIFTLCAPYVINRTRERAPHLYIITHKNACNMAIVHTVSHIYIRGK